MVEVKIPQKGAAKHIKQLKEAKHQYEALTSLVKRQINALVTKTDYQYDNT